MGLFNWLRTTGDGIFAESNPGTRQRASLPSAARKKLGKKKTLGKEFFAECFF